MIFTNLEILHHYQYCNIFCEISAKLYDWWFNSINYVGCFQYLPSTVLIKAFCQFCQISCLKNIMQLVIKIVLKYLVLINGTFWFVMIFRHLFGAWESIYIVFFNYYYLNLSLWKKKIGNGKFMILKCTSNVDTEKVHYWQRYPMIRNTPLLHFVQVFVHFLTNITSPSVFIFCN